jgi:cyclopropane fatty-acyl-phospholipid synthase-like methyltransferase
MNTKIDTSRAPAGRDEVAGTRGRLSVELESMLRDRLRDMPWTIEFSDWNGARYRVGLGREHWCGDDLRVTIKTEAAGRRLASLNALGFLDKFLEGEVDLEGNLYALADLRAHGRFDLKPLQAIAFAVRHWSFQTMSRARVNVKSHYDIPQEALDVYLDKTYRSYSCGMFEAPHRLDVAEMLRCGAGEGDTHDSLEKAQWRKFADAADYIAPSPGESLLDIGCGYGGQLAVALERHPFGKVVGWTHSANQAREGRALLAALPEERWELNEGDYRRETRVFDHVTSTGMVSHVGPRGLVPYVTNVRKRIQRGGRYLHHALMVAHSSVPHDFQIGLVFNKKYVWPGFHWAGLPLVHRRRARQSARGERLPGGPPRQPLPPLREDDGGVVREDDAEARDHGGQPRRADVSRVAHLPRRHHGLFPEPRRTRLPAVLRRHLVVRVRLLGARAPSLPLGRTAEFPGETRSDDAIPLGRTRSARAG